MVNKREVANIRYKTLKVNYLNMFVETKGGDRLAKALACKT